MGNVGAAPPRPAVNQEQMLEMQIQAQAQRQAPILKQEILANEAQFNQMLHQRNPIAQAIAEDDDFKLQSLIAQQLKKQHEEKKAQIERERRLMANPMDAEA